MINFRQGLDHLRYKIAERKQRAAAAAADLSSVPSGIKLQGTVRTIRLNKRALYVAIAIGAIVLGAAVITAPEPTERVRAAEQGLQPEQLVGTQAAWWKSTPDFFVAPEKPAPAAPKIPEGGPILPGNVPPPPPAPSFSGAPPLLPANGGRPGALPSGGGSSELDPRTARAPMVAYRAPAAGSGVASTIAAPAVQGLVPARQPSALQPQVAQAPAVLTPSAIRTEALGQGIESSSPYSISIGWTIPGVLITGANSDTPGMLLGQVAENVFDSRTGKHLLIPAGSRLVGTYATGASFGQERLQVSWIRMVYPDGTEYDLSGMSASDSAGSAGMKDQVNNHYGRLITSAMLMSWFGVQTELASQRAQADDSSINAAMGASTARELNSTAQDLLRRESRVSPTIEIRPGYRFNIVVSRTVVFNRPYQLPKYQ